MSFFNASQTNVGSVVVATTQDKGHDPQFWAKAASDRIVSVGGTCHPLIAQQAEAFKQSVETTGVFTLKKRSRAIEQR